MKISGGRKKYLIDQIRIEERDPSIFADLAFFFDREDVLNDVSNLRKAWIGNALIPHDQIDDFINKKRSLEEARDFLNVYWPQVYRIARKYGVKENFIKPISAAVLSGTVIEGDYFRVFEQDPIDNLSDVFRLSDKRVFLSNNTREIDLHGFATKEDNKSIATVKRDRDWYWLYQTMGYRKVAKLQKKTLTTVVSAINSYSSRLQTYYSVTK